MQPESKVSIYIEPSAKHISIKNYNYEVQTAANISVSRNLILNGNSSNAKSTPYLQQKYDIRCTIKSRTDKKENSRNDFSHSGNSKAHSISKERSFNKLEQIQKLKATTEKHEELRKEADKIK